MNILLVNKFHWLKGGSESAYFGVSRLLEAHGHQVVPFSMKDPRNIPSHYENHFVDHVSYHEVGLRQKLSGAGKIIFSFEARRKMEALLREVTPDVGHFHVFQHQISPSVFGPLRSRGIPLVLTLHDLKPICPNYKMLTHDGVCERCKERKFYNCLLHRCTKGSTLNSLINMLEMYLHYALGYYQSVDQYIAVSRHYRDKMLEFGFPASQVSFIPNFIDASDFAYSDRDLGYGLYFGRIAEEKGIVTLLEALRRSGDIPFLIVGSGPYEAHARQKAADLGLKRVTFTGFKSGHELKRLIAESSFTVVPSEWSENCPMSILESHAVGKPVIGSRIGGIPELIEEGVDGVTFEPSNPDDLANKMNDLQSSPDRRRSMGKRGRHKIEVEYSPEKHYGRLMKVYNSVLRKS